MIQAHRPGHPLEQGAQIVDVVAGFLPHVAAVQPCPQPAEIGPGKGAQFIDDLKLRASWGRTGNDRIDQWQYLASYGYGSGYAKFNRRADDWAMVAACALVKKAADGSVEDVRVGLTHMGSTPLRATAVEEALRGGALDAASIAAAAEHAAEGTSPPTDLNSTAEYKQHLARVLTKRALEGKTG